MEERSKTAPQQVGPQEGQRNDATVHLPALLSDEFGISRSQARQEVILGVVHVGDEHVAQADALDLDYEATKGKTIKVAGVSREFTLHYEG